MIFLLVRFLLFSVFFLLAPWVFAQNSDQSSSDSGVLVAGANHAAVSDQDSMGNNRSSDVSSQNATGNSNNSGKTSNSDGIVDKATTAVISEMTVNLKLTQDQISAIGPIVADNIAKMRSFQQDLVDGIIDAKTMNSKKQELMGEENLLLGSILNPDQMKVWTNMQAQNQPPTQPQTLSNSSSKHGSSK